MAADSPTMTIYHNEQASQSVLLSLVKSGHARNYMQIAFLLASKIISLKLLKKYTSLSILNFLGTLLKLVCVIGIGMSWERARAQMPLNQFV
jgi:hypothetical protein